MEHVTLTSDQLRALKIAYKEESRRYVETQEQLKREKAAGALRTKHIAPVKKALTDFYLSVFSKIEANTSVVDKIVEEEEEPIDEQLQQEVEQTKAALSASLTRLGQLRQDIPAQLRQLLDEVEAAETTVAPVDVTPVESYDPALQMDLERLKRLQEEASERCQALAAELSQEVLQIQNIRRFHESDVHESSVQQVLRSALPGQ